jgi:hypothetical protein
MEMIAMIIATPNVVTRINRRLCVSRTNKSSMLHPEPDDEFSGPVEVSSMLGVFLIINVRFLAGERPLLIPMLHNMVNGKSRHILEGLTL